MTNIWHYLTTQHPVISAVGAVFVYSNLVGALPKPTKTTGAYLYFYAFNHGLAGNIEYAVKKLFPQFFPQDESK